MAALAVAAAVGLFGWRMLAPAADETTAPNWPYVSQAREQAAKGAPAVTRIAKGGAASFVAGLAIADADKDDATTASVRDALARKDVSAALDVIALAQHTGPPAPVTPDPPPAPAVATPPEPKAASAPAPEPEPPSIVEPRPQLSLGLRDEILRGDAKFFHIYLYDSCINDGDVVDILVNGEFFAQVTIHSSGVTLSLPISSSGATTVQLRGVHDGGGGITVACRTSEGDYFMKDMDVGEVQAVSVGKK